MAGTVTVDGRRVDKAGTPVPATAEVAVLAPKEPFVSRAGRKLAAALDHFGVDPAGLVCLDVGASTGGFTDCLLQRGAVRVYAVDVGYGQLDAKLRNDPRVVVMERVNARHLAPDQVPGPFGIVTIDVSFISLRQILPVVRPRLAPDGDVVALVKPQFEAGRDDVERGGLVTDPSVHVRVLEEVRAAARAIGLTPMADTASPITGATGNQEFLLHLRGAR